LLLCRFEAGAGLGKLPAPALVAIVGLIFSKSYGEIYVEGLFQAPSLVIFGIAPLGFGPKKHPELGKGLGDGILGFKPPMKDHEERTEKAAPISEGAKTSKDESCLVVRKLRIRFARRAKSRARA